jgi:Ca2+-transporting ATPase
MDNSMAVQEANINAPAIPFRGLTAAEVEESRRKFGANLLTPPKRDPWWKLYLEKFNDPIIRILMLAAFITIIVGFVDGHFAEGIGIIIAILLATTLAFVNEYRARREFDVLNQMNDEVPISVIRDGNYMTVPRKDLVVGDIVLVEAGDEVAADGTVREAVALQVNEALLTGEALPVYKTVSNGEPSDETMPTDKLYRSTLVVDGRGIIELTAVGNATKIGEIAREATGETGEVTPLNAQLERLSKLIGVVGFTVAALTYAALVVTGVSSGDLVLTGQNWYFVGVLTLAVLAGLSRIWLPIVSDAFELAGREFKLPGFLSREGWQGTLLTVGIGFGILVLGVSIGAVLGILSSDSRLWLPGDVATALLRYFMVAVTIIVVAVPEGLPMSVTLSLAYSMRRMTATNNLVRRMHATETVGAATVIASDKTGTLTLNQMRVAEVMFPALGNQPLDANLDRQIEQLIAEAFSANTTANLSRVQGEEIRMIGDGTEGALLLWLDSKGVDYINHRARFGMTTQLTFSPDRKYMGTMGRSAATGEMVVHIKGAPEVVLAQSSDVLSEYGVEPINGYREQIETQLQEFQRRGMRTLAFAYKPVPDMQDASIEELADGLIWLGYVAIADPIRPEVPPAVAASRKAGIRIVVVTGDNAETAKEIARQIGLWEKSDDDKPYAHLSGAQFATMDDEELAGILDELKVVSRARPLDKMRLVTTLQGKGNVVAVTGDGTNDAPALNYANVGLAMGSGTDIAKEASDIILLDDSFRSIVNAVMWGRSLYENIQRFILFQLTINVAALGIALLGPFIGVEFPLTVIQMLWVNLIMDTFASLALATEPPHWEVMQRPPRRSSDFIIAPAMARGILGFGLVFIVVLVASLILMQSDGTATNYELSMFYAGFILLQFWNLFNARALGSDQSAFKGITQNRAFLTIAAVIAVGTILIVTFGGAIFRTTPLALTDWVLLFAITSPVLWVGEAIRWYRRHNGQQPQAAQTPA